MNPEIRMKLCSACNENFSDCPCEPDECAFLREFEDVVPVVRCKDCRFYNEDTVSCSFVPADVNWYGEDFCSYGERKC